MCKRVLILQDISQSYAKIYLFCPLFLVLIQKMFNFVALDYLLVQKRNYYQIHYNT